MDLVTQDELERGYIAYDGTIDGVATTENPNRTWGLEVGLDDSPQIPESVTVDYYGKGSTITEPSTKETPYYPLEFGVSDVDMPMQEVIH